MTRLAVGLIILFSAGCGVWSAAGRAPALLLERADRLATEGEYARAVQVYDEVVEKYPHDVASQRARASRDTLATLLEARAEIERLHRELALREAQLQRLRRQTVGREAELSRVRQELTARQAEVQRLTLEAERLRENLESLKRVDMRLERRKP